VNKVGSQQSRGASAQDAQEGSPTRVCSLWWRAESDGGQNPADSACALPVPEADTFFVEVSMASAGVVLCQAQHQGPDLVDDRWAA
jgi:hypothetical protein